MSSFALAGCMLLGGVALGYCIRALLFLLKKNSLELSIHERIMKAREHAQSIVSDARKKIEDEWELIRISEREKESDLRALEERLVRKETLLDERGESIDLRSRELSQEEKRLEEALKKYTVQLEALSGLSQEEAYRELLVSIEREHEEDFQVRMHKLSRETEEGLKEKAKNMLASVIQRLAVPVTHELTTTTVSLSSEEVKGKIIGKEGRNIRTFERFAGVEILLDEQPGALVVSSFDPVRRAIAVRALGALISDGRIQPAKIEEEIERARNAINDIIKEKGSAAVFDCGIVTFDPRLVAIIGRLHFRTSYGQNVLQHSIEMAHIADMLAKEIGADSYIARAGALVHDLGKALDHEFEGTHVDIGIRILRRFSCDERIITAMKSHHDDCPHESLEAVIVQVADMISGARPGARRESADMYLKRLTELEGLARRFPGVEKVYALQAGREIRIFVHPDAISDIEARNLARTIALQVEEELRYPGQIKITLIRETRVIDFAR